MGDNIKESTFCYAKWYEASKIKVYVAISNLLNSGDVVNFDSVSQLSKVPMKFLRSNKDIYLLISKYIKESNI